MSAKQRRAASKLVGATLAVLQLPNAASCGASQARSTRRPTPLCHRPRAHRPFACRPHLAGRPRHPQGQPHRAAGDGWPHRRRIRRAGPRAAGERQAWGRMHVAARCQHCSACFARVLGCCRLVQTLLAKGSEGALWSECAWPPRPGPALKLLPPCHPPAPPLPAVAHEFPGRVVNAAGQYVAGAEKDQLILATGKPGAFAGGVPGAAGPTAGGSSGGGSCACRLLGSLPAAGATRLSPTITTPPLLPSCDVGADFFLCPSRFEPCGLADIEFGW